MPTELKRQSARGRRGTSHHEPVLSIQRSRMLAAAAACVEERGYTQMTVEQIVSRAKVSRKTFYDVFANREDCFCAVFEQTVDRVRARASDAYSHEVKWRNGIRSSLAELLTLIDQEPGLARLCLVDALGGGGRVLGCRARVMRELARVIDRARLEGGAGGRVPPELTAEGIVGGICSVLHSRLLEPDAPPMIGLLGPIMSMIVLPYFGPQASRRELLVAPPPTRQYGTEPSSGISRRDPLGGLKLRLTHRTIRVLIAVAEHPGASNRIVAERAGIVDQGQISKLMGRLVRLELVENRGAGHPKGAANEWHLTPSGAALERATRPQAHERLAAIPASPPKRRR
jgi:AcrR family transcriptional regulator/DNA-binding MarR family transcriptional regulator